MCGISGIISKHNYVIGEEPIRRMTDLIKHRGPDGEGYYFGSNFAFGHRRLAILDLTSHGSQPMSLQNRYWITYNGEVYNYLEIREQLKKLGYEFNTNTDTEVILFSYLHWGEECLSHFNGMWSFAIYDSTKNNIFIARDRFGIKPLYYIDNTDYFAFGSEIKQLIDLQPSVHANRNIVIEALLTGTDGHTKETYFSGVNSFPQSHCGYYDLSSHNLQTKRYYDLKVNSTYSQLSYDEATSYLYNLFTDSVSKRMRSDVQVGTCLSGGLDSSSTSAIASKLFHEKTNSKFIGINAKSIDPEKDESYYAKIVSEHAGIDLHIVEPVSSDFLSTIDDVVVTQEEPFVSPSMFMGWHVFNKASSLGCKVMLNGQGGDEILLGYERYYASYLRSLPLRRLLPEIISQSRNSALSIKELILYNFYFNNSALRINRYKRNSKLRRVYNDMCNYDVVRHSSNVFGNIQELQINEIMSIQLPHLLRYEDRNSMRHSVETRLPFLDYRLVEFCISIQPDFKIKDGWTKHIMRKAIEPDLPESIAWRKNKLGFEAPTRTWFRESKKTMRDEILGSSILKEITNDNILEKSVDFMSDKELWKYFMLSAWERNYNVVW